MADTVCEVLTLAATKIILVRKRKFVLSIRHFQLHVKFARSSKLEQFFVLTWIQKGVALGMKQSIV